jgi:hypothetical protein
VEEDGSANFQVPSGKYLYFQLLDEDKKMVQTMRSGVIAHPGETNGCIGCHEDRLSAPPNENRMPIALRKGPHLLVQEREQRPIFSYMDEVQPIFDKNCLSCHDFDKEGASALILAGDRNPYFNASYVDLHVKNQVACIGGGPATLQQAYSWGSHRSPLIQVLENGHHDVSLSKEEMETLCTWIDLNGVYYSQYESAYPYHPAGRSPLSQEELDRLGKITGVNFGKLAGHARQLGPQISFERPELSPCLSGVKGKKQYKEALEIIRKGRDQLATMPRADMQNFIPCEEHRLQLARYHERQKEEEANNKAISEGEVRFETYILPQ